MALAWLSPLCQGKLFHIVLCRILRIVLHAILHTILHTILHIILHLILHLILCLALCHKCRLDSRHAAFPKPSQTGLQSESC